MDFRILYLHHHLDSWDIDFLIILNVKLSFGDGLINFDLNLSIP